MASSKDGDKDPSRKLKVPKRPEFSNGGSLEDCASNVFSLLELPGIKWKCFCTKPNAPRGVPLTTDLVLKAYSKCVLDKILCTWRRKQLTASGNNELLPLPHFSNDTPKELWVFWYDDEPEVLKQHTEELECDEEMSSAAQMNIVSYEVRTILFKALHVVLERDLTRDGFVRFGRWFTIPFDAREGYLHYLYPAHNPAIRLNFFVHGAHTVCASVQAQRQPTLLVLARRHLEYKGPKSFAVIVGPWSMRGVLVQDQIPLLENPEMQETSEKEWNHWKEYLQMEEKEPEKVSEEKTKSPEPESSQPQAPRALLNDSSDEEVSNTTEQVESGDDTIPEDIPQRLRWMYEPDISYKPDKPEKPREETVEEKEKREQAREKRRKRRKDREERRKEIERQRADVTNPEEYDSDVVTDPETEDPDAPVNNEVPKMVLLEIDGVRMLYPSKYVCVTLEADRQVLESMGQRTNTVPDELQVQGRRPRNKFVVNVANPMLSTLAVYQYIQKERLPDKLMIDRTKPKFGQAELPAIKKNHLSWKMKRRQQTCCHRTELGVTDYSKNYWPPYYSRRCRWSFYNNRKGSGWQFSRVLQCPICMFYATKSFKAKTRRLNETKAVSEKVTNRVRRKRDFHAFWKKKAKEPPLPPKVKGLARFLYRVNYIQKKKARLRLKLKDPKAKLRYEKLKLKRKRFRVSSLLSKNRDLHKQFLERRDNERPNDAVRAESEDETYQMDALCQKDWANFDGDYPKDIPQVGEMDTEKNANSTATRSTSRESEESSKNFAT
uniref:Mediator of RNA polymerase II transcription subunit 13 n=1 Tax=Caenorhabditis japonica TaxID=281687 RepID=A0A8R1E3Z6_CAEJA